MRVELEDAYAQLLQNPGVVFLIGGIDTGKTTFGLELVNRAMRAGMSCAYVDSDVGQSTVGPPTTIGLRFCRPDGEATLDSLRAADSLSFIGSIAPKGHLLPMVTGTAKLTQRAREAGCDMVAIDTSGLVEGVHGQMLKYSKLDLIQPDWVLAFERGGELEPIVGIARRFSPAKVLELGVGGQVEARTAEERMSFREEQFAAYFAGDVSRWRIKPTVFMPTLPPEFDLAMLDSLVVGMENGKGSCVGIGILEYDSAGEVLRMVSPVADGVRGLRLGSVRIEINGRSRGPVDIRQLFGSE